jgi:uncharacterized protein YqiB (DUF1249 family)
MQISWNPQLVRLLRAEPTVGALMELCEESYGYLRRMVPRLAHLSGHHRSSLAGHVDLHLEILEQSRYTTLLRLTYHFDHCEGSTPEPDAVLRAYHDARQVEVVELHQRNLPLERLFQAPGLRNRWRANLFVSRWLSFCARQGHRFPSQATKSGTRETCTAD